MSLEESLEKAAELEVDADAAEQRGDLPTMREHARAAAHYYERAARDWEVASLDRTIEYLEITLFCMRRGEAFASIHRVRNHIEVLTRQRARNLEWRRSWLADLDARIARAA